MSTFNDVCEGLGTLIDLYPDPVKPKKITHKFDFKYDLLSSDVVSAWADTSSLIGEAYFELIDIKMSPEKLERIKEYRNQFKRELDLTLSVQKLEKELANIDNELCHHTKLNRELKVSHD
jgi:hypothetical protein